MGDRIRAGITCAFGVPGEKDNSIRVVEFCKGRELCVGNTYFKLRSLHMYARVARGQGGVESIIELVLMKSDMLRYVQDVRAVRGMERGPQTTMLYCVNSG